MLPGFVGMIPMFNLYTSIGWYDSWSPIIVPAFLETPRSRSCLCSISERSPFHLTRSTGHLTFMSLYVHAGHHDHGDLCIPRGVESIFGTPALYYRSKQMDFVTGDGYLYGHLCDSLESVYGRGFNLYSADLLFFFGQKFYAGLGSMNSAGLK